MAALVLLAGSALRAENARLPYSYLYHLEHLQAGLAATYPDVDVILCLESTLPRVHPSDIHATIESKSGKIPLTLESDGAFVLPMRDDLLAENPWIVTDQPRGTMAVDWKGGLAPRLVRQMTNTIHYASVMGPLQQCDRVQETMRSAFPGAPRLIASGLEIIFAPPAGTNFIVIRAREGNRRIQERSDGSAIIPLDSELLAEDPLVMFSSPPRRVGLVFRKAAD